MAKRKREIISLCTPDDMQMSPHEDDEPFCYTCVSSADWQECESCEGGWVESDWDDFSDDTGLERCQWCNGTGGWWVCLGHEHHGLEPGSIHRIPLEDRP